MRSSIKSHLPDFLGIGAARSGTTWISQNLTSHPDIWIPRIKELHYFTRSSKYDGPSQLADPNLFRRFFYQSTPYKKYRTGLFKSIGSNIIRPSASKLKWDCNYLFGTPSDEWYANLFRQGEGKTTGEITPRYSALDSKDIKSLKELIPNVKLIFIMRDPVDRAWSLMRYHEKRNNKPLTELPIEKLKELAFHKAIIGQSDYESILERWKAVFPENQFLVAFYDEITDNPAALLERICKFLGLDLQKIPQNEGQHRRRINPSFEKVIPRELENALIDHFSPMVKRLSIKGSGYFSTWLNHYSSQ